MEEEEEEEEKQFAGIIYHHKYKFVNVIGGGGCSVTILTQLIEDPRQVRYMLYIYIYIMYLGICTKNDKYG